MSDTENTCLKIGAIERVDVRVVRRFSLFVFHSTFHNTGNSNLLALRVD